MLAPRLARQPQPASSRAIAHRSLQGGASRRPAPVRCAGDAGSSAAAAAPARRRRRTTSSSAGRSSASSSSSSSSASSRSSSSSGRPRGRQQSQPELAPHSIQYVLNPSVASYTGPASWDESADQQQLAAPAAAAPAGLGSPSSNGSGGPVTVPPPRPDGEAIRGLVYGATVRFSDSSALRLRRRAMVVWDDVGPRKVLIVKKQVPEAAAMLADMAAWLSRHGIQVYVERSVQEAEFPGLLPFQPGVDDVDFAITLGGDGTVLYLASLFAEDTPLPPVMCFAMGTLGFLTPFDASQFRSCLARVLAANRKPLFCTLRTRKRCAVLDGEGQVRSVHHILNECVIDRGAFPSSLLLELYVDGGYVTTAEADGLIVATPSGSTAYSMSAGGSMVAPSVPCTLITPLSPHSLSFRPLIIPENADVLVRLPMTARSHARASFDGKHNTRIARGTSISFQTSLCPLPLINIGQLDTDWYEGINRKLGWNRTIRGVPASVSSGLELASQLQAKPAATPVTAQLQLSALLSSAAQHEAKVANWVGSALVSGSLDPADAGGGSNGGSEGRPAQPGPQPDAALAAAGRPRRTRARTAARHSA